MTKTILSQVYEYAIKRKYVDIVLLMIYTGFRASEFLNIENKNINFEEQYVACEMKTDVGQHRVVPIHDAILPFFKRYYRKENKYLFMTPSGRTLLRNYKNRNSRCIICILCVYYVSKSIPFLDMEKPRK